MSNHVLVPVDSSAQSEDALEYAMETFPEADITALHALEIGQGDIGTFSGMTGEVPDEEAERERAEELFESVRQRAADHDGEIDTVLGRGRPDRVIVKEAEKGEYDSIVIGSHGRDGVARVLLGSVAEKVVRRSPVPVFVVR
ncbi:Nucleotide-binding universal stress protein, UspA family [Halobiforma haloterrestris]|uniref:Nucleotide-binding universal stress protein, UspA family n=1 Tax=Natronobacterium haloterrestre TaxID=148448 RepID=A0A1I1I5P4_NATHA|nr:universal stress protein [Halobiforma haloterrestris]SFC29003.1 Nucleotide-binding universal stress protein, UspA family [Halobiforma haloterrestris]